MDDATLTGLKRIEGLLVEALRVSDSLHDPMLGAIIDEARHRAREMQAELIPDLPQAACSASP